MFEREIKFIYDFNLNKVNRLGPYFTFEQLLASDVHPAILQYISAEIDYLIYEDRQKLLKNSLFDYSGEKISFHFNQISEEAKKSKRFAQEYIAKLILHASSFTINYLVRPKWTLTKFVFDEDTTKSTNDIKQILNYVYYYKYVNKILVSYINSKKILSMNVLEFEDLLNKADRLGVETYLPAILTNALKSMAEFFNIGEIQKTKIPLSAIEMFLEEKELIKHLQKVTEVFGHEEGVKFNLTEYQKVFGNIIIEKEEMIAEPEELQKFETEEVEEKSQFVEELESVAEETEDNTLDLPKSDAEPESEKVYENEVDLEKNSDLEEDLEQQEEHDEAEEDYADEDIIEQLSGNEIKISQPQKFRIKINEDSRIEPVVETPDENIESELPFKDDDIEHNETEEEELIDESSEEDSNVEELDEETNFRDELKLAEKEFDEEEDDESFLQSIREQKNIYTKTKEDDELPQSFISSDIVELDDLQEQDETIDGNSEEEGLKAEDEPERVIFTDHKIDDEKSGRNYKEESGDPPKMDMAEILEHKEMTKIIEVIFDYDIEDFAATLDEISNCRNEDDAHIVINNTLLARHISRSTKEAQAFRAIISEYFSDK